MYVIAEMAIFGNMEAVHIPSTDLQFYEKVGNIDLRRVHLVFYPHSRSSRRNLNADSYIPTVTHLPHFEASDCRTHILLRLSLRVTTYI